MAKEIERKFLVNESLMSFLEGMTPTEIQQGYLSKEHHATVRVRLSGDRGFLTIKGRSTGISCDEFEYEIPRDDAEQMLAKNCTGGVIVKRRYEVPVDGFIFEIDVFGGALNGLIVAEVELPSEHTLIVLPKWIGKEVSLDHRYKNSTLAEAAEVPAHNDL